MLFSDLIARADDVTLQELIGAPTIRLLRALDPALMLPSKLKQVALGLHSPEELLGTRQFRAILFDLLRPAEARQLAQLFGTDPEADVYDRLKGVSVTRGSSREHLLYTFFGLDAPQKEEVAEAPAARLAGANYGLFPHQRRAARTAARLLREEPGRVLLHMPTGAGKTRTAMNIISEHLREREPGLVIWLAYSEELCEQAAQEFESAWAALGNRDVPVHRFWGARELNAGDIPDGIIIAGLGKMYGLAKASLYELGRLRARCTLLVMDEAHQAIAETYQLVLEALLGHTHRPGLLGLTATPGRTWADIDADEKLAEFFCRRKVMLEVEGYETPINYLVEEGYLAQAAFNPLFVSSGLHLTEADLDRIEQQLDVPESILRRLAEDEQRNLGIIYRIEELITRHERVLVFATTVEHSDMIATILQARGIRAHSVTGKTSSRERAHLIDAFRSDEEGPRVLINYGVLTTGFDAPRTSAVLIARPTQSLVLYSQMVGRAIRGPRAGGSQEAEVVTVIDQELPGFRSVSEAFTNWEDVWR